MRALFDEKVLVSTRIDVPLDLRKEWRAYAIERQMTLTAVVREALAQYLAAQR